jgi:pimeloyl-ACP methyl ester carboxylesterase
MPNVICEESPSTFVGGLAHRPVDFDYSWMGSGRFCATAINVLGLDRFQLVVHDIGRPVGFELAEPVPDRIASLTVPNTLLDVDTIKRPWPMEPRLSPTGSLSSPAASKRHRAILRHAPEGAWLRPVEIAGHDVHPDAITSASTASIRRRQSRVRHGEDGSCP